MIGLARRHWPSMMLYRHWPFVGVQLFTPPFHTAISHILEYLCVYFLPLFFVYKVEMHLQTKLAKPVSKKEPVTPVMIYELCIKFAGPSASLSDLRLAAICVTAYAAFLRFNELAALRCCDVKFCDNTFVEITIVKSKTDQYRDGSRVLLAKTGSISCPFDLLERYVCSAGLQLSSTLPFFRALYYQKSNCSYKLRSEGMSYTRTREIVLHAFAELGYPKSMFGLHSLRAGGASAAANAGISDRLFKRHGRWKSDSAKDAYVKDKLDSLLSVSRSLGC